MAHWCRICGEHKANERFSGKRHRDHICKACSRKPKAERDAIDHEREISDYFDQRNISKKNLKRLLVLVDSANPRIAALADAVYQVGLIKPHKRKRIAFSARRHQQILKKLGDVGLIIPRSSFFANADCHFHFCCEDCTISRFNTAMDELRNVEGIFTEPEEVEKILQEYSEMVGDKT